MRFLTHFCFLFFLVTAAVGLSLQPALARHHAHHLSHRAHRSHKAVCSHVVTRHGHRHVVHIACASKKSVKTMSLREAQEHLTNLGYYHSRADGKMGSKTRAAIKAFQHEHNLRADGVLGSKTAVALTEADGNRTLSGLSLPPGTKTPENFYEAHPDFYGHVDQQYADPLARARPASTTPTEGIPSRFGQVAVTETVANTTKHYNVTLNGQPILMVDNQPSVIGVSRTFDLGAEDAIVFSTYNAKDLACSFRHYVLVLSSGANALRPLDNCTRGYQASVKDNSLFISFPETDDARPVGATWRYNDGNLVRL